MKINSSKFVLTISILVLSIVNLDAQEASISGYFLENYNYRHQFNPSFTSPRNYLSIMGIQGIGLDIGSNLGVRNFIFHNGDQEVTFMHESVDAKSFLSKLHKNNSVFANANINILNLGVWGNRLKGYTTFDLGLCVDMDANIPYDLFSFAKEIGSKSSYDISSFGISSNAYLQAAIGHSHRLSDMIWIGGKLKFKLGLASINTRIDNMRLEMSEDVWKVKLKGDLAISPSDLLDVPLLESSNKIDFKNINYNPEFTSGLPWNLIGNYGAALDFGITIKPIKTLIISAAVTDLGFRVSNNSLYAKSSDIEYIYDGFDDISFNDEEDGLSQQYKKLAEEFSEMLYMEKVDKETHWERLNCRLNIGIEYNVCETLSVAALSSTRFNQNFTTEEGRLFLNFSPCKWFDLSANYGLSNYGRSLGAMMNISLTGFNLFISSDRLFFKFAQIKSDKLAGISLPIYGPSSASIHFGIMFNLSKIKTI